MSNQNYIIDMLELKDSNIHFKENFYFYENFKGLLIKYLKVIYLIILVFALSAVLFLTNILKSMVLLLLIL